MGRKSEENQYVIAGTPFSDPIEDDDGVEQAVKALKCLPGGKGCYAKLYRVKSPFEGEGIEFLKEVMDMSSIDDIEIFLRNSAIQNRWPSGDYVVYVFKKGEKGPERLASQRYSIEVPDSKDRNENGAGRSKTLNEQISDATTLVDSLKKILPDGEHAATNALMKGVDLAKQFVQPATTSPNGNLSETIALLKELGIVGQQKNQNELSLKDVILLARELSSSSIKTDDSLTMLRNMAEIGVIDLGKNKNNDPIDGIHKISELITALGPLIRNESGGGSSGAIVELIRTVGPAIPDIVKNAADAVKEVVAIKKAQLSQYLSPQANRPPAVPNRPPSVSPVYRQALSGSMSGNNQNHEFFSETIPDTDIGIDKDTSSMGIQNGYSEAPPTASALHGKNLVLSSVLSAIEQNDTGFFPKLGELIITFAGQPALEGLLNESIKPDYFLATLSQIVREPGINSPVALSYLEEFIESSLITIRCAKCNTEFDVSPYDWKDYTDDEKICTDCGGIFLETVKSVDHVNIVEDHQD